MHLVVQRQRIQLQAGVWISPEDIMRKAIAASFWPRCKVYIDWGFGKEPVHTPAELAFASRLVHAYHCFDISFDHTAVNKRRGNKGRRAPCRQYQRTTPPTGDDEAAHYQEFVAMLGDLTPPSDNNYGKECEDSEEEEEDGDESCPALGGEDRGHQVQAEGD
jgi:hypothetical protein